MEYLKDLMDCQMTTYDTRLHTAAEKGQVSTLKHFLENGMSPHELNSAGETALHLAAKHECAMLLIAAGARIDAKDASGRTPLHHAMVRGDAELASFLIDAGADACTMPQMSDHGNVRYLVQRAAPFFKYNNEGGRQYHSNDELYETINLCTFMEWVSEKDKMNDFDNGLALLQENGWLNRSLSVYDSSPSDAPMRQTPGSVSLGYHGTPLCEAASSAEAEWKIPALISAGADLNLADEYGSTPLFRAVEANNPDAVSALLDAGADPLLCCRRAGSILHVAARSDSDKCLEILLRDLPQPVLADILTLRDGDGRLPHETSLAKSRELDPGDDYMARLYPETTYVPSVRPVLERAHEKALLVAESEAAQTEAPKEMARRRI